MMHLSIAGCGDAFGSGGRLQSCYHVKAGERCFLVDSGATALIGLNRMDIDPNGVETIFISHLHGDHYSGIVWWLIHAHHVARRTAPLTIAGPPGIEARVTAACEALFPGSSKVKLRYPLHFEEITAGAAREIGGVTVAAFEVKHPSGAPSHALRLITGGKTLAFSGDTEWVEPLVDVARGADLMMLECYGFEKAAPYHMHWRAIEANLPRLEARRFLLVHMGEEMLARSAEVTDPRVLVAEDGMRIIV